MKTGLLERILIRRYGQPELSVGDSMALWRWNTCRPRDECILYVGMKWHGRFGHRFASLKQIYGEAFGGFLIGDSLKIAVLLPCDVYGLWRIDELQTLPPVRRALEIDPDIEFFMDAANVWYYGHKKGELYVFDTETHELDSLGPVEPALEALMDQWEDAGTGIQGP
jgi:hypothetical protein